METIALPCGRRARLVPADVAGEFRLVINAPSLADRLRELGCDQDEIDAAAHLADAWARCRIEKLSASTFAGGGARSGNGGFEERVDPIHWRRYCAAMAAMGPWRGVVANVVIEGRPIGAGDVPRLRDGLARLAGVLRGSSRASG